MYLGTLNTINNITILLSYCQNTCRNARFKYAARENDVPCIRQFYVHFAKNLTYVSLQQRITVHKICWSHMESGVACNYSAVPQRLATQEYFLVPNQTFTVT
jgi:hypothetical protein